MSEIDNVIKAKKENIEEEDIHKKIDILQDTKILKKESEISSGMNKTKFTKQERNETIKKFIADEEKHRGKLRRRERKMVENAEYDSITGNVREIIMGLAIIGIIVVILLWNFLPNTAMFSLLIIIGATSFLPMGMILGWLMFDPVMRCKFLRKISKRNYGVINFVGHGNKAFPKIKNFDHSLIWKQNECWVLAKSRVYQMSKDGNAINDGKQIEPNNVLTYVDTVPIIFIDMHSMEPISIEKEGRTAVYPGEIGSALKSWVDNQRAKMMAIKKMTDTMMIVAIIACIGAVMISFVTMGKVDELTETINTIKEQLQFIIEGSP